MAKSSRTARRSARLGTHHHIGHERGVRRFRRRDRQTSALR